MDDYTDQASYTKWRDSQIFTNSAGEKYGQLNLPTTMPANPAMTQPGGVFTPTVVAAQQQYGGNITKDLNDQLSSGALSEQGYIDKLKGLPQMVPGGPIVDTGSGPKQVQSYNASTGQIVGKDGQVSSANAPVAPPTQFNPLQPGSADTTGVKALQDQLVKMGLMTQDQVNTGYGTYGPQTTAAVKKLQGQLGIDNSSGPGFFGPKTIEALNNPQNKAFLQANKSGEAPPTNGSSAAQSFLDGQPKPKPTTSPNVENFLTNSPVVQQTQQQLMEWLAPQTQKDAISQSLTTLVADRKELAGLKLEYMNVQRLKEGNMQAIRDEITKAGGTASESQIQALTIGRNNLLLQEQNRLADLMALQQDMIANDTTLLKEEKDMANTQFSQRMGILGYIQKNQEMIYNANRDAAQDVIKLLGPDGLYASAKGDPVQIDRFERSLGIPSGSLAIAAQQIEKEKKYEAEKEALDAQLQQAQIANINSQIEERRNEGVGGTPTITGKPQTTTQAAANGYADRLGESDLVISNLGGKFTDRFDYGGSLPNFLQSEDRQLYEQAKRNFVTAILRRESGAAISPTEFSTAEKQYFPQAGDKPDVVTQKEASRNTAINNLYRESNVLRPVLPGQIIESDGKRYRVGADGETLTPIK